jgi:hypothetical protein
MSLQIYEKKNIFNSEYRTTAKKNSACEVVCICECTVNTYRTLLDNRQLAFLQNVSSSALTVVFILENESLPSAYAYAYRYRL